MLHPKYVAEMEISAFAEGGPCQGSNSHVHLAPLALEGSLQTELPWESSAALPAVMLAV